MSFKQFAQHANAVGLLQRSLTRGRLGHAYIFSGHRLEELEAVARTLAKTLNCEQGSTPRTDSCDQCLSCRKIDQDNHPDISWIRPESKSRVIKVDQMRELMRTINLKPTQAAFKLGIISGADRLNEQSANAFLKTLEEPPPCSILVLLTTDPSHLLETVVSRCLRLTFGSEDKASTDPAFLSWLQDFSQAALQEQGSLLSRYRLLSVLLKRLTEMKERIETQLSAQSPLERFDDIEPELKEKWEEELKAAIEAEYRRQRAELLAGLQWWLRDVWLQTLAGASEAPAFPQLQLAAQAVAKRIVPAQALQNLRILEQTQYFLTTNLQEALALEVGLLKLKL